MSYATVDYLRRIAPAYEVIVPADDDVAQRALDLAVLDLERHLGARYALPLLTPEQAAALVDACAIQALFRITQSGPLMLGEDDGLSSAGGVTFSLREPRRLSPEAVDRVAGQGLYARSGTVVDLGAVEP